MEQQPNIAPPLTPEEIEKLKKAALEAQESVQKNAIPQPIVEPSMPVEPALVAPVEETKTTPIENSAPITDTTNIPVTDPVVEPALENKMENDLEPKLPEANESPIENTEAQAEPMQEVVDESANTDVNQVSEESMPEPLTDTEPQVVQTEENMENQNEVMNPNMDSNLNTDGTESTKSMSDNDLNPTQPVQENMSQASSTTNVDQIPIQAETIQKSSIDAKPGILPPENSSESVPDNSMMNGMQSEPVMSNQEPVQPDVSVSQSMSAAVTNEPFNSTQSPSPELSFNSSEIQSQPETTINQPTSPVVEKLPEIQPVSEQSVSKPLAPVNEQMSNSTLNTESQKSTTESLPPLGSVESKPVQAASPMGGSGFSGGSARTEGTGVLPDINKQPEKEKKTNSESGGALGSILEIIGLAVVLAAAFVVIFFSFLKTPREGTVFYNIREAVTSLF